MGDHRESSAWMTFGEDHTTLCEIEEEHVEIIVTAAK
jgi:hypothetical protein